MTESICSSTSLVDMRPGWVGGWLNDELVIHRKVEEEEVVGMRCCGLLVGGWLGR